MKFEEKITQWIKDSNIKDNPKFESGRFIFIKDNGNYRDQLCAFCANYKDCKFYLLNHNGYDTQMSMCKHRKIIESNEPIKQSEGLNQSDGKPRLKFKKK